MKNRKKTKKYLSTKEAGAYLGLHPRTIQRLAKQGEIKCIKLGRLLRFKKEDIIKYYEFGTDFTIIPKSNPVNHAEKSDRRSYPRINCSILCDINVSIPFEKEIKSIGRIMNISQTGILIKNHSDCTCFTKINSDDPINLKFYLDNSGNDNNLSILNGRVVRMIENGIAVKFRKVSDDVKFKISEFVG